MEGGGVVYEDSRIPNHLLLKSESSEVLDSLWLPNSSPSFHASASMVIFEENAAAASDAPPLFAPKPENCSDDYDPCLRQPEKKRRLSHDQVQFLEKSFEVENKLEPERKIQLAKEVGLQPRQVAIWFQNRRARYKTKILEREYGSLKATYDKLKSDYDTLFQENEKMRNEVDLLSEKLRMREKEKADPATPSDSRPEAEAEAAGASKSDVFDSDSPHYADSSHVFEASDFSQDEEDNSFSRSLMPPSCFPKLELECYDDLQPNSCNLGFPVQDQGTWFWQC